MNNNNRSNNKVLLFFSLSTFLAGQLAALFSFLFFPFDPNENAYSLPSIYPANWVFVGVWMILYPCMGLAMGHIYQLKKQMDTRAVLFFYITLLSTNLMFLPIMNLAKGNPAIMTLMDFNGIVSAVLFSCLCFNHSKTAFYWSLPLSIWMPITFIIKVALWAAN